VLTASSPVNISSFSLTPLASSLSYSALVACEKSSFGMDENRVDAEAAGALVDVGLDTTVEDFSAVRCRSGTKPIRRIFCRSRACAVD
jgi:hypothetical protein